MAMRVLILGCGIRGRVYASSARTRPDLFEIAGIADPAAPEADWKDWREALEAETGAEGAIIALPDAYHLAAAQAALAKGLHILLEKPLGCSWDECLQLKAAQRQAGRLVMPGFVLRYSKLYKTLDEVLAEGKIGEITDIRHTVALGCGKAAHAFCRGNWAREEDGSTALVQKCTHDFDLIARWAAPRRMLYVSSSGALAEWKRENKPANSANRCIDCPDDVRQSCPFDAVRLYIKEKDLRYHFPDCSDEAMRKVVRETQYGECVYLGRNNSVNHQRVLMEFEGALTVTLELQGLSLHRGRTTHFYGTRGEIEAKDDSITLETFMGEREVISLPGLSGNGCTGHDGGDAGIMDEFLEWARKGSQEDFERILADAFESHRIAFLAEERRRCHV